MKENKNTKNNTNKKENKKNRKWLWGITITCASVLAISLIVGELAMSSNVFGGKEEFFDGTSINGIDISGMSKKDAANIISAKLTESRDNINIKLTYHDKIWEWKGSDFELNDEIMPIVEKAYNYGRTGNIFERRSKIKSISKEGFNISISYKNVLGGIDERIQKVIEEIEKPARDAQVDFSPTEANPVQIIKEEAGIQVDTETLYAKIDEAFLKGNDIQLEVPTKTIEPATTKADLLAITQKRSEFSTNYEKSSADRKNNIKVALAKFNGLVVQPDEEVSFNQTTGSRTAENGYKKANIILNGVFVEGSGGGVCQASTTLYNALLLSGLQILEVNKHSLPVSYVPLAFDAMVSEGYSDLRFINNTQHPIYFKTDSNNEKCTVQIYGVPFASGEKLVRRANFIRTIPHNGDTIVQDTNEEYADKVTFKGEYIRLKSPQEGYESEAFIDHYVDNVLIESTLIRHEIYEPQQGVIIEGVHEIENGMTLPENTVKFIPPQEKATSSEESAQRKIESTRPTEYNP